MSKTRLAAIGAALATQHAEHEVTEAFAAAGVDSIVMKGPALAAWLGNPVRVSTDVDLLVHPRDLPSASRTLEALGYQLVLPKRGRAGAEVAVTWQRLPSSVRIDLHHSLYGATAPAAEVVDLIRVVARQDHDREGQSRPAAVLGGPGRLLLLALHAAQHGALEPSPLEDLAVGLAITSREDWRRTAALASAVGAEAAFAAGLRLLPPGAELASVLGLPMEMSRRTALRASTAPHTALGVDRLAAARGSSKLVVVLRELFPSRAFIRDWMPSARRGVLWVALAYLYRPIWLARWAVPGYLAWRRAHRATRR